MLHVIHVRCDQLVHISHVRLLVAKLAQITQVLHGLRNQRLVQSRATQSRSVQVGRTCSASNATYKNTSSLHFRMLLHEIEQLGTQDRWAEETQEQETADSCVLGDFDLLGRVARLDFLLQIMEDMAQFTGAINSCISVVYPDTHKMERERECVCVCVCVCVSVRTVCPD
jgi:hypothetical protein